MVSNKKKAFNFLKEIIGENDYESVSFFDNVLALPNHLRAIYYYLWRKEFATLNEIICACNVNAECAKMALNQLCQMGLVEHTSGVYKVKKLRKKAKRKLDFSWRSFSTGPYLAPIYHYNLLSDTPRVQKLKMAIDKIVKPGDIVVELGCGTGILSLFAAKKAKKVYSVEINPFILEFAKKNVSKYVESKKITFINSDARNVQFDEDADVIICEMVDTALITEHQIPVMNHAVKNFLKPDGKVIPFRAETYIELVYVDYNFEGYEFPLPFYEEYGARPIRQVLSNRVLLHSANFNEINPQWIDKEVEFNICRDGLITGFRLTTIVYADEAKNIVMYPSPWFNPPLVFPVFLEEGHGIEVSEGDKILLKIYYEMGSSLDVVEYSIL